MFEDRKFEKIIERLDALVRLGQQSNQIGEQIMGGLTALNAVVTQLQTDLATLQTTIQTAIAALGNVGDPDASVQAAATALQAVDTALESAQAGLAGAVTPPVTPPASAKK